MSHVNAWITTTTQANIVPEIWSNEIRRTLDNALFMKGVLDYKKYGPGGDTFFMPTFGTFEAEQITEGTELVGQGQTPGQLSLVIDQNWGVPFTISLRTLIQMQQDIALQAEYQDMAGRALAVKLDTDLMNLYSSCTEEVVTTNITADNILEARELLRNVNCPADNLVLLINPHQERVIMKISDFVDVSKYGSATIVQNGEIGRLYGIRVLVTNQIQTSSSYYYNLLVHKDFARLGVQQEINTLVGPVLPLKQGFDVVASMLYGTLVKRANFGVRICTTA